ncbi:hypothetical protein MBM_08403 [Drepanopeziza brunnea f. sp. 'multigermtubi' MB_m1]|uniref:Uncharacterized protein n=1 Tax=Marssonina brunnea f. sp. multigermtubi (strain MB_m1) TaxID=1072389 RepID=K1W834_MARBU|nr:uncharacterized protein MBM_08403 [Drepanopeziza brunnea f. sp. 'multigermtubi' MB_m1]EKD13320.1 hypothetical protein MBM_08403 [Drepanopeziza brunnea f. sp. 'multigermtubi' MB_m1]
MTFIKTKTLVLNTYPFSSHRASTIAASSITSFIDLDLRIEALTKQLTKRCITTANSYAYVFNTEAIIAPIETRTRNAAFRVTLYPLKDALSLKVTFAEPMEMDKLEPAYTAILNRNALRPEDLRNFLVILLKAFKAVLKLKAKPSKTAKSYEGFGKVIFSLRMDYEATRIKLLKGRDLLGNLTFNETIAFFAAFSTSKRSSSETTVSVTEASEDCLIISSKLISKATDDPVKNGLTSKS